MTGRLVPAGDSVRVLLTLHDVRGDSVLAQGEATGTSREPWRQGLIAVSSVLPRLIPGSAGTVSAEWRNRNPGAVAQFLLGESRFRRAQMTEALDHYRRAVSLDSTFAFAALRGAQAATWKHRGGEAATLVSVALAQPLPPRYHHLALGFADYVNGRADSAAAHLNAALQADPDMTVAWMELGEVYTHLLPLAGDLDSLADRAFLRARQLDTASASVLLHPIEMRLLRGDTTAAAPLLARFRAASPDSGLLRPLFIIDECVRRGARAVDWGAHAARIPLAVLSAAKSLAGGGAQLAMRRGRVSDTAARGYGRDRRGRRAAVCGDDGPAVAADRTRAAPGSGQYD